MRWPIPMMRRPAPSSASSQAAARSGAADRVQHLEHQPGRAAVERPLERADRGHHRRHQVRARRRDDARGEGGGVHAVLAHRHQVALERGRVLAAPGGHPQVVGGVRARRVRTKRRLACVETAPGGDEHRRRGGHEHASLALVGRSRQLGDGGAKRVHRILRLEGPAQARDRLEGPDARLAQGGPQPIARLGTGIAPSQSIRHASSKLARPASASTSWPAITSLPRSPSTSLSAVRATSTPSSPFALTVSVAVRSLAAMPLVWPPDERWINAPHVLSCATRTVPGARRLSAAGLAVRTRRPSTGRPAGTKRPPGAGRLLQPDRTEGPDSGGLPCPRLRDRSSTRGPSRRPSKAKYVSASGWAQ